MYAWYTNVRGIFHNVRVWYAAKNCNAFVEHFLFSGSDVFCADFALIPYEIIHVGAPGPRRLQSCRRPPLAMAFQHRLGLAGPPDAGRARLAPGSYMDSKFFWVAHHNLVN